MTNKKDLTQKLSYDELSRGITLLVEENANPLMLRKYFLLNYDNFSEKEQKDLVNKFNLYDEYIIDKIDADMNK